MSEKRGPPSSTPYAASAPPASYPQMVAQGPPPSYAESLSHPVVAAPPGVQMPQYAPYVTNAAAAASAAQLQNYKDQLLTQSGQWYLADPMLYQMIAANQQAQKIALSQQAAQQQQAALYMQQQQQALYMQQLQGYYPAQAAVQAPSPFQPGQNVLVMNGYDGGARFDGIAQPTIPPPPPGVAPNAAQLAAASGAHVAATQKKSSFLSGVSGGGYTFF